jgi:CheY-like chemotaxis protein
MRTRVLIADSDHDMLPLYDRYFSANDCQVETAAGGVECMHKLSQFVPDVMVVDMHLLWGGGDGVLAAMKEDRSLAHIPVVLLDATDVAQGVVARHHKPVSLATLLSSVRQAAGAALPTP